MNTSRRAAFLSGFLWLCVGCDQGAKRLAERLLRDQDAKSLLGGAVRLMYSENTGAWGSLGEHWPSGLKLTLLTLFPALVLAAFAVHAFRKPEISRLELLGYAFLIGGGIGNILDRLLYGHVVDFLYLGVGGFGTNIFNVADVAIMTGMGLLVLGPGGWLAQRSTSVKAVA